MNPRGASPVHRGIEETGPGVHSVRIRLYAEINDFVDPEVRQREIVYRFLGRPTVKDAIEGIGVPHVEVEVILVDGRSVGFDHALKDGDRVAVYPVFETLDVTSLVRLREQPLRRVAFLADVHLRRLARLLRLLGLDTALAADVDDAEIVTAAVRERRILLTRDRQLLKHGAVTHGYWVRSTDPIVQAREILRRFDLVGQADPYARCLACNGIVREVDKQEVIEEIPPKTARWLDTYRQCSRCGKLTWRGTHFARIEETVARILDEPS